MGLLDGTTQKQYYEGGDYGNYQFTSLDNVINQFIIAYVGENKIISKAKRTDVAFHAQRAMQELSFDTFKSIKSLEIVLPASLQMPLPRGYVNYTRVLLTDNSGIKHPLYPTSDTQNPFKYQTDDDNEFLFSGNGDLISSGELIRNGNFHGGSRFWILNETNFSTGTTSSQTPTSSTVTATNGDPVQGYFYGFNGNAIGAYDVPQFWGIRQPSVQIRSNEEYKITYTLSGYTSGTWNFHIVDENGDSLRTTDRTADGTYEETVTASANENNYPPNSVFFRNSSTTNGNVVIDSVSIVRVGDEESSTTWSNYKSSTPSENNNDDYEDDTYWPIDGNRYGIDPQHAQANGSYYIDNLRGLIHFSSNCSGKTIVLDYISDSLGTDDEMHVHKFAEEAMYKWIAYAILSTSSSQLHQQLAPRFKKERFAAIRAAKLRLSNIKLEEITQILRGKSKQIKH